MSTTFAFHYRDATTWLLSAMDHSHAPRWTNALDAARRALAAAYGDAEIYAATSLIDVIRRAAPVYGMYGLPAPETSAAPERVYCMFCGEEQPHTPTCKECGSDAVRPIADRRQTR